jgi:tRNA dimethylallyltransferase
MAIKQIIQVLGPTGVGKSRVAIRLAGSIGGEIISADSAQVYKDFNIGADKLDKNEWENIPHYLIDILEAGSQFNASMFIERSFELSEDIVSRGKAPIVCGGTALYLSTMIKGIFPESKTQRISRDRLKRITDRIGLAPMYGKLQQVDPEYAEKVGPNDRVRIIRALEIFYNNGRPPTEIFRDTQTPFKDYQFIRIGLNVPRDQLYKRIEKRVDHMISRGLVEEVQRLKEKYPPSSPAFKSLGYKEIMMFFQDDKLCLGETVDLIKQHSRNFAKRQLSWFRREEGIEWFDPTGYEEIEKYVMEQLEVRKEVI